MGFVVNGLLTCIHSSHIYLDTGLPHAPHLIAWRPDTAGDSNSNPTLLVACTPQQQPQGEEGTGTRAWRQSIESTTTHCPSVCVCVCACLWTEGGWVDAAGSSCQVAYWFIYLYQTNPPPFSINHHQARWRGP